jgi:hypothetical protein
MLANQQKPKSAKSTPEAAGGPAGTGPALREQLRGMGYEDGKNAVSPRPRYGPGKDDANANAGPVGAMGAGYPDFVGGPDDPKFTTKQELADPKLARDDKTKARETHEYKRYEGKLFYRGVRAQDVSQGWLADCYLAAALASVAQRYPETIKSGIVDRGGDVYAVRFYQVDWRGKAKEEWVEVDADFPWYQDKNTWAYLQSTQKGELWPSIIEKAYAVWKAGGSGDYDTIGQGGWEGDVMEALTGLSSDSETIARAGDDDALWEKLTAATADKKAMTAGTFDDKNGSDARYGSATGIYGNHAYTVMGTRTRGRGKNKVRKVILRNPWGSGEPTNNGKDDGIFEITLAEFREKYETLTTLDG